MPFNIVSSLKMVASTSKGAEVRGLLYRAADELQLLKRIRTAVRDCTRAQGDEEKRVAWEKVKELCQVSGKE